MPLEQPLAPETGWITLTAPELVKFSKPGETLTGVLLTVERVMIAGKQIQQYTIQNGEKRYKVLASYDLLQQLTAQHRGCQVRIKYLGEHESVRGGAQNTPMKCFSVQVKGTPSPEPHGGPITDEDIPF